LTNWKRNIFKAKLFSHSDSVRGYSTRSKDIDTLEVNQKKKKKNQTKPNQNQTKNPSVFYLYHFSDLPAKKKKRAYIGYKTKINEKMLHMKNTMGRF
jgi:hypothetical protein